MQNTNPINDSPFLLVSVGSYQNRGCEAIVRGTMEVLRHEFGRNIRVQAGVVGARDAVKAQNLSEIDDAVNSFALTPPGGPRGSLAWFAQQANQRFNTEFHPHLKDLDSNLKNPRFALEVGGDNYSVDYGRPVFYIAMDRYLQRQDIPVVLWGASVGPFDSDPRFAPRMFDHLRSLSAIFVRETDSLNYLAKNGVGENVHLVADPAFVMNAVKPPQEKFGFEISPGTIGINLSQMVAFYRGQQPRDVSLNEWLEFCIELVIATAQLGRPILLIPHVGNATIKSEDFGLMYAIWRAVEKDLPVPISVITEDLNAAELKWVISRCDVFAGARTHSTIAGISSLVPTLSISYSLKAKGINRDVYDSLDYCVHVSDLTPKIFVEKLRRMIADESNIREHLKSRVPNLQMRALGAGPMLRAVINEI